MTKAVLTAAENSAYEDLKERWYHFPNTYLRHVKEAEGDLVSSTNREEAADVIIPDPSRISRLRV